MFAVDKAAQTTETNIDNSVVHSLVTGKGKDINLSRLHISFREKIYRCFREWVEYKENKDAYHITVTWS